MNLQQLFPKLAEHEYQITSPATPNYNCIAWAAGDDKLRWDFAPGYYWPQRIPRNGNVDTIVQVFRSLGYVDSEDGRVESGVEKVALYAIEGVFTHVARQTLNGKWTSKLGTLEDIEHDSPVALEGTEYGQVVRFLERR